MGMFVDGVHDWTAGRGKAGRMDLLETDSGGLSH